MALRFPKKASLIPVLASAVLSFGAAETGVASSGGKSTKVPHIKPRWTSAVAFDKTAPLRDMITVAPRGIPPNEELIEMRTERMLRTVPSKTRTADGALQGPAGSTLAPSVSIASPSLTFEGMSNQDNFNIFGGRVNPPDTIGDVGPNNYVQMINLVYAIFDKAGNLLLGPVDTGTLWAGFAVEDCTDPSGDPVVVYDQLEDRWLLSQFTTRGLDDPSLPFYNCVAISVTGDPTGAYYRYAFITQPGPESPPGGTFFPDYPKYGVWKDSYVLTTRDFGLLT